MIRPLDELVDRAPVEITLRDLLGYWGIRHRTAELVKRIEADLRDRGLTCIPSPATGGMSDVLRIAAPPAGPEPPDENPDADDEPLPQVAPRVGDLETARTRLVGIGPTGTLQLAHALMQKHEYSQLPVLSGSSTLHGAVSWESIAQARVWNPSPTLSDAIQEAEKVSVDDDLLTVIPRIEAAGYVFVIDESETISGIVTTADLSHQFARLAGPYFVLGEIERRVRRRVNQVCSIEEVRTAANNKKIRSIDDTTFGNLQRVLAHDEHWKRLCWDVDHAYFVKELDRVRLTRNDVMHFRPDPLKEEQRSHLTSFAGWLRKLDPEP
jgi:restriction system protein